MSYQIVKTQHHEIKTGIFEYLRNNDQTDLIMVDASPTENQPSRDVKFTYDGDLNTIWVSDYNDSFDQYFSLIHFQIH